MSSPTGPEITCYNYNYIEDLQSFNDSIKCSNSDSCCGPTDLCLENRLCQKASGVIVRPSCANSPWTLSSCAQICLYDNDSGFVPRVNICPDGSFCCDNDPTCCATHSGAILDAHGNLIAFANQTTTSSASSSSSSSTTTSHTSFNVVSSTTKSSTLVTSSATPGSSSPAPTALDTSTSAHGLSTGAEVGIGVGVGLGALLAIGLIVFYCRRRRRDNSNTLMHQPPHEYPTLQQRYPEGMSEAVTYMKQGHIEPSELDAAGSREHQELPAISSPRERG